MDKLQIKLVHKILALVLIPFFFNGLWLFLLNDALMRKTQMVEIERGQAQYLENLNHGLQLFYDATGKLFEYELTSDPAAREHGIASMKGLRQVLARMRLASEVSQQGKQDLEGIGSLMDQEFADVQQNAPEPNKPEITSFLVRVNQARRVLKKSVKNSTSVLLAIEKRHQELDQLRQEEKKSASNLETLVKIGFAGNLLIALVFAYFVVADFSKRLNILLTNSQKLGKRLPITGQLSGNDELNSLDAALQAAAADLQEAFDFRASLMEMVAHDLRSPLQASQISLQSLAHYAEDKLDEKAYTHIERVQTSNGRLLALIEDLLTIDRLESGELELDIEEVKIRKVVTESVLLIGGLAAASQVRIINRCADHNVAADGRRLAQVFNNILSNAIKYSPPHSEIEITTSTEGSDVVIAITDQGPGMSQTESKRIFDKFYQIDDAKKTKGFGLGLAICKMIVTAHNGRIGVESAPKKGSRFWFTLPLS